MKQESISRVNSLLKDVASLPEPKQTEYIYAMRLILTGMKLAECEERK